TSGLIGEAELLNGTVIYDELDETVKDINGKIDFGKEAIKVDFDYSLDKNKGQFKVNYTEKEGISVDFKFKDLPYFIAEKYKLLGDLNLPLDDYKFKNVDVKLTNNQKNGFEAGVKYKMYPIVNSKIKLENINGDLRFKDGVLNLSAKNIEFLVLDVDYKKEINYDLELNLQNENLKLKLNSNFIDFLGEYKKSDKTLKLYQKSKKAMEYNFEKQNLNFLELEGKNLLNNYKFLLKVKQEKKILNIEEFSMENSAEEKVVQISGDFDIEKIKYNIKINTQNLKEENLFSDKKLGLKLDFIGELSGEKEKFILRGVVKDFLIQNKDILIKSYGNISFLNSDGLKGEIDGELRLGKYKDYKIEGLKIYSNYLEGKLKILDVRNDFISLSGLIDFLDKKIDLKYSVNGLKSSEFEKKEFDILFNELDGEIKGNFESIEATMDIKEALIEMPNKEFVLLKGEMKYKDDIISTKNFKINQSLATISYNFKNKIGDFNINILEENLAKYYNFKSLKYRALARVAGKIEADKMEANIGINIDKVYLNGNPIINLSSNMIYKKNSDENILRIENLDWINLEGKKILNSNGKIDLLENSIEYNIAKQILNIDDFKGMFKTEDMKGTIKLESNITGDLKNPKYTMNLSDGNYEIKGFKFEDISLDMNGDKDVITIDEVLSYYQKNEIRGEGKYNINPKNYSFNIYSKNINLNFLNAILPKDIVKDIEGTANIDVKLSSNLKENSGYVDLIDFNANLPKTLLDLKKLNIILKIDNEKLTVSSLEGYLNDGLIKGDGYLKLPKIEDIIADEEFYKNLNYAFNLTLKNVIYELKDYFRFDISTDLIYSKNKISGNVILNGGEITGILKEDKGLILTVLNFIIEKTRAVIGNSKKLGEKFEIKGRLDETPEFNVRMIIKDGININIPDVSTFAQDVQGTLQGRLNLIGKNDKVAVIGEVEIQKGSFVLGSEDFKVTRAMVLSDTRNGYLSNFNPNLILDVSSLTAGGNVEISLQGELNSLILNITTNQGSESSSLKNLFEGNKNGSDKNIVALLFKTLIDSQISSTLLRPISKTIKNTFHISKFRIVSDMFNQEVLVNSDDPKKQDPNAFSLGAYLEAENPIYKDKYFWILKLGIIDGSKYDLGESSTKSQSNEISNSVSQFDFKVERRYRSGWSYGTGVSRLNETNMIDQKKEGNLNYYVDFKFERKYNNVKDIFSK
ncbi:MAG: translocation/assembly module TamB domain-containing protein, partial [Cetobacterium sp.]